MFRPLVSIIIPVYNGEKYLREAIDSALSQSYPNIEIIVINDGSTDGTDSIAKSYEKKIRYYEKINGGVSTALNFAIKESKGEFISWLSHDDVYFLTKIEQQVNELNELDLKERSNVILYSNYTIIDIDSNLIDSSDFHLTHDNNKLNHVLYPLFFGLVNGCTLLIPKKCFDDSGLFDEKYKYTQDYRLWYKMFPRHKIHFMKDRLIKSRMHSQQGSNNPHRIQECDDLWIWMIKYLDNKQVEEIGGNRLTFYLRILPIIKNAGYKGAQKYLEQEINKIGSRMTILDERASIPLVYRVQYKLKTLWVKAHQLL